MSVVQRQRWTIRVDRRQRVVSVSSDAFMVAGPAALHLDEASSFAVDPLAPHRLLWMRVDASTDNGRALLDSWLGSDLAARVLASPVPLQVEAPDATDCAIWLGRSALCHHLGRVDTPDRWGFWCAEQLSAESAAFLLDSRLASTDANWLGNAAAESFEDGLHLRTSDSWNTLRALALDAAEHPGLNRDIAASLRRAAAALVREPGDTAFSAEARELLHERVGVRSASSHPRQPLVSVDAESAEPLATGDVTPTVVWLDVGRSLGAGPESTVELLREPGSNLLTVNLTNLEVAHAVGDLYLRALGTSGEDDSECMAFGLRKLTFVLNGATATVDLLPAAIAGFRQILLEVVASRSDAASAPPDRWEVLARARWSHIARAILEFAENGRIEPKGRRQIEAAAALSDEPRAVHAVLDDLPGMDLSFIRAVKSPARRRR